MTPPKSNHSLRFSVARGFRAPGLKELYFYFVDINHNIQGNKDLTAETSTNVQFSYDLKVRFSKNKIKTLSLSPALFFNDIQNQIQLFQIQGVEYSYTNIGHFQTLGAQLETRYRHNENWSSNINLSYIGRSNIFHEKSPDLSRYLFSPELQTNIQYELPEFGLSLNLFHKYNGALPFFARRDGEILQITLDGFHNFDASVSKRWWQKRLTTIAGVKNLFDVTNLEIQGAGVGGGVHGGGGGGQPALWGRTAFMSLRLDF